MEALQSGSDVLFILLGAIMVFLMHAGFAFLEVGTVRKKNQVNALVMRPGGYKTIDYMKAGFGMTFLYLIIQVGILSFLSSG